MRKVKITADAVLAIVRGIFEDEDVNVVVEDTSAPESWQGKSVGEILNVEYFTFKHRPVSTQDVINKLLEETGETNHLAALDRSFCLLSLGTIERLYTKDVDIAALTATLEYYIQSDKLKLLEYLIEDSSIATSGLRIPVQFSSKEEDNRKAVIFFGRPNVGDIQTGTPFGECALVEVDVTIMLFPNVISYSDYEISVTFIEGGESIMSHVPVTSFSAANVMTQESTPYINNPRKVGNINLSCANSFVLVFDGYDNAFINHISDKALSADTETDNNELYTLTIKRGEKSYTHKVVIKDHQMMTNADTGNETHTLTFTTRGIGDGST